MDRKPLPARRLATKRILNNQRGIALLVALFAVTILIFIAVEVSYESNVEYIVSAQGVNELKAYYAAKAGVEISLLRIVLYKKAIAALGDKLGNNTSMLDPIWQFPLAWPPSEFLPKDQVSVVEQDLIKSAEKKSSLEAQYVTSIENEGAKIDINDLGSDLKSLREATKNQILKTFQIEMETNEEFYEKYGDVDFQKLVNNMIDWVDEDTESLNGGDENSYYDDLNVGEYNKEFVPPNQPFKTLAELHMVAEMKDGIYDLLKDRITVFGVKGIEINYANKDLLKSLDPQIKDEVVNAIIERRDNPELGGPFKDEKDFIQFIGTQGVRTDDFNKDGIPLLFGASYNFKITSTGEHAGVTQNIEVVTYDFENLKERVIDLLNKADEKNNPDNPDDQAQKPPATDPAKNDPSKDSGANSDKKKYATPKGRPRIVLWHEY